MLHVKQCNNYAIKPSQIGFKPQWQVRNYRPARAYPEAGRLYFKLLSLARLAHHAGLRNSVSTQAVALAVFSLKFGATRTCANSSPKVFCALSKA